MILGVDHVALTSSAIDADVAELRRAGYIAKFVERSVPNAIEKTPFLRHYAPDHAIAYCQRDKSVAIELVQHDANLLSGPAGFHVLMGGMAAGARTTSCRETGIWRTVLETTATETRRWEHFNTEITTAPCGNGIRGVLVWVRDTARAVAFWTKGLGCRTQARSQVWAQLAFPSLVPAWSLTVVLAQDTQSRPLPLLDDAGFSCLALLTNSIESDMAAAVQTGATFTTGLFEMTTGGKSMCIGMLRGTDGELVELIEVKRN
jgi:hypothetical protein